MRYSALLGCGLINGEPITALDTPLNVRFWIKADKGQFLIRDGCQLLTQSGHSTHAGVLLGDSLSGATLDGEAENIAENFARLR